jgi:hypothetical protein
MPLYPELATLSFPQLITAFEQPRHVDGVLFYQEVAGAIRAAGDLGLGYLLGKLTTRRSSQVRATILGLTFPPVQEPQLAAHIQDVLRQYIQHQHALIAMDAIDALCHLDDRAPAAAVLARTNDASPYLRSAVVRYVAVLLPEQILAIVLPALQDPDHIVRESAIDALDEADWVDAAEVIRPYLKDPHPHVRQAAATALEHWSCEEKQMNPKS